MDRATGIAATRVGVATPARVPRLLGCLAPLAATLALSGCGAGAAADSSTAIARGTRPVSTHGAPVRSAPARPAPARPSGHAAAAAGIEHGRALAKSSAPPVPPAAPTVTPVPAPPIHRWPIPFGATRKREMAEYSLRHYGERTYVLSDPRVIVEHYTETATAQEAFNTFAPDVPDNEFHELPNTCAHFLVEPDGRIDQLVPLGLRCRHTTGLNWTAIGIENVGFSDQAILHDARQLAASLQLTRWLRCRYAIAVKDVIGHNESLTSPYHHDRVPAFQHQTHSDWNRTDMNRYRALLRRLPCVAG